MQAQHMVMDTLALAVSATATYMIRHLPERLRLRLPIMVFPLLAAADIFSIYHELKSIQLRSINKVSTRPQFLWSPLLPTATRQPAARRGTHFIPTQQMLSWLRPHCRRARLYRPKQHWASWLGAYRT